MGSRRSSDDSHRALKTRVTELEARVRWLERRLKQAAAVKAKVLLKPNRPARPRCPGCFAQVPARHRSSTCTYCGFSFDVVAPFKPRRPR
jgi:hypothetical protein